MKMAGVTSSLPSESVHVSASLMRVGDDVRMEIAVVMELEAQASEREVGDAFSLMVSLLCVMSYELLLMRDEKG